jgi:hypothetical protein
MALFNDGTIASQEDLRAYESSVLEMASTEGVDLTAKRELAQRELAVEIVRVLTELTAVDTAPPSVTLDRVVVTEPMHQWHSTQTLTLSYRDAFHNQLNDRYESKWKEYERQSGYKAAQLFETGLGIVNTPLKKAAAPTVSGAAGILANGVYEIRVTWENAAGQEGAPSERVLFASSNGDVPAVTVGAAPAGAVSWNVYAAPLDGISTKQNTSALALGETWTMPAAGLMPGAPMPAGQSPDYYLRQLNYVRQSNAVRKG